VPRLLPAAGQRDGDLDALERPVAGDARLDRIQGDLGRALVEELLVVLPIAASP